jgi:hypothetical protein
MTITEKIKALMAKAASTDSQHEAETFLAKAHELMEKHQLSVDDLEADDPIDKTVAAEANGGASPDWDFQLMFPVSVYFGCKAIQCHRSREGKRNGVYEMDIIGRESARVTAIETHKYLVATVRRLGREHAAGMGLSVDKCTRRIGRSLALRIQALVPKEDSTAVATTEAGKNALITLDRVLVKFKEMYPDMRLKGGRVRTNNSAKAIADGIGLNLQTGGGSALRIGGSHRH